jgi:hypothetical protein
MLPSVLPLVAAVMGHEERLRDPARNPSKKMKKIDQMTREAIRNHVRENPECTYADAAVSFDVSEVSVKRICADIGRTGGVARRSCRPIMTSFGRT